MSETKDRRQEPQLYPIVDPERHLTFAEFLRDDGMLDFWVIDHDTPQDWALELLDPAHELEGPLPLEFLRRLGLACGAPTRSGDPCRNRVHRGERCAKHRGKPGQRRLF